MSDVIRGAPAGADQDDRSFEIDPAAEQRALDSFTRQYPEYAGTSILDEVRRSEFGRLDRQQHVYVDYTGAGLYADSQVRQHAELLAEHVFGNPHSSSPCSERTTALVERARQRVLDYFKASTHSYTAVFTANATAALKLVGEAYPFGPGSTYLLAFDNHNSVNGIREFARSQGATVAYAPLTVPDLRFDRATLDVLLERRDPACANLFAFPAQSNFSGVKHPLDLVERAHEKGWDVLLDAAAFVSTNRLDLARVGPDFVAVSFYKMFGYPTGVGCLLARTAALEKLRRPWFAGGTVNFATVKGRGHILAPREAGFEDGTLNFLDIPAVEIGLGLLDRIGIDAIGIRVRALTGWLLEQLLALNHSNGRPMVRIYGPATMDMRGGTVTINLYDPDGHLLDYRRVEELASNRAISLRTGCFCNPGAGETAEDLTESDMRSGLEAAGDMSLPRFAQMIQHLSGKSAGAIRLSLGLVSNFADVYRVVAFIAGLRDQTRLTIGEVSFDIASCRVIRDGS
jgi:selenocysteine lyase/cysteine desulfurase